MKFPNQPLMPFLTFTNQAEAAMYFYASALPGARIEELVRHGKNAQADEGTVLKGDLCYKNQHILFLDMPASYPAPAFNWAATLLIPCEDEAEFDGIFAALSDGGMVMMGPEPVMDMRKCTWVTDKFGVTWQLVWA